MSSWARARTCAHTHIHKYIHTHIYTHTYINTHIYIHIHTHLHTHTYIRTYPPTYTHTYTPEENNAEIPAQNWMNVLVQNQLVCLTRLGAKKPLIPAISVTMSSVTFFVSRLIVSNRSNSF